MRKQILPIILLLVILPSCQPDSPNKQLRIKDLQGLWILDETTTGSNFQKLTPQEDVDSKDIKNLLQDDILKNRKIYIGREKVIDISNAYQNSYEYKVVRSGPGFILIREIIPSMPEKFKQHTLEELIETDAIEDGELPYHTGFWFTPKGNLRLYEVEIKDGQLSSKKDLSEEVFYKWEKEDADFRIEKSKKSSSRPLLMANEFAAIGGLHFLVNAQENFFKYADQKEVAYYWVKDVWGLWAYKNKGEFSDGEPIGLTGSNLARADYKKGPSSKSDDIVSWSLKEPAPKLGYYFAAFVLDPTGEPYGVDVDGDGWSFENEKQFAFMAFPKMYGKTGYHAFIINQEDTVWRIDAVKGGFNRKTGEPSTEPGQVPVKQFPANPEKAGYTKVKE